MNGLSIIWQNVILSLSTESIVTYMTTKNYKVTAFYTLGNFASYVFRDTYRNYCYKLISKFSLGFMGGLIKYSITKTLVDFVTINKASADEQKILKNVLFFKIILGGINNGCYEIATEIHKNIYQDKYNISSTLYWHTVPHAVELLEAYSNNVYISNSIILHKDGLSEHASALLKLTSIRELIDATIFYNALVGAHYDTNFTGIVKNLPIATAAAYYNFGKQSYYFNAAFVSYVSLRYVYHNPFFDNTTKTEATLVPEKSQLPALSIAGEACEYEASKDYLYQFPD